MPRCFLGRINLRFAFANAFRAAFSAPSACGDLRGSFIIFLYPAPDFPDGCGAGGTSSAVAFFSTGT